MGKSVHDVVREFVTGVEEFKADDLADALRAAGHTAVAERVLTEPEFVAALVNEHAV